MIYAGRISNLTSGSVNKDVDAGIVKGVNVAVYFFESMMRLIFLKMINNFYRRKTKAVFEVALPMRTGALRT